MADHAISADPAVQRQLDRLWALSPGADVLGLDRVTRLLARLGDPHHRLPPVFHVAGTNGKGSTCAFLRAAIEAAGLTCHVYSSPHLVRFNERIRLAGRLIGDDALAPLLDEVLDVADGLKASFFEITTAAAFLAFSRNPADACVVEVGLGGRLDATNVIARPAVTGIAQLGIDHVAFLGDTAEAIAAEKAGIAKPGVPLVTMHYPAPVAERIAQVAAHAGAPVVARDAGWFTEMADHTMRYSDPGFSLVTDRPRLAGMHQPDNLGLAIAMLRHQDALAVPEAAFRAAADWAIWPARLQRLGPGPLVARLGTPSPAVLLDGAHNESAAAAVAASLPDEGPLALVTGLLANKDAAGVLRHLVRHGSSVVAVPVSGHDHHAPSALADAARAHGAAWAGTACSVADAFDLLAGRDRPSTVLVAGSLYLAGEVLVANDELPT